MATERSRKSLLGQALSRFKPVTQKFPRGHKQARVVACAASKGGVGKTTTVVNLGCALAREHKQSVLIIDMDPQGHVTLALKDAVRPSGATLSDVLLGGRERDVVEAIAETSIPRLTVTGADKHLNETERLLATKVGRELTLKQAIQTARTRFDVILLDCPPNLGDLTTNALVAADSVLIPCDMSVLAVEGVIDLMGLVDQVQSSLHPDLNVLGVVRTRVDRRNQQINETVDEALDEGFGALLFDTAIPINSALANAQAAGQSIFDFQPRARGAAAYRALAAETLMRLDPLSGGR